VPTALTRPSRALAVREGSGDCTGAVARRDGGDTHRPTIGAAERPPDRCGEAGVADEVERRR
jgi:hypothetical protein